MDAFFESPALLCDLALCDEADDLADFDALADVAFVVFAFLALAVSVAPSADRAVPVGVTSALLDGTAAAPASVTTRRSFAAVVSAPTAPAGDGGSSVSTAPPPPLAAPARLAAASRLSTAAFTPAGVFDPWRLRGPGAGPASSTR
jgi:hypothetical protein